MINVLIIIDFVQLSHVSHHARDGLIYHNVLHKYLQMVTLTGINFTQFYDYPVVQS